MRLLETASRGWTAYELVYDGITYAIKRRTLFTTRFALILPLAGGHFWVSPSSSSFGNCWQDEKTIYQWWNRILA